MVRGSLTEPYTKENMLYGEQVVLTLCLKLKKTAPPVHGEQLIWRVGGTALMAPVQG